ncbi:MAG: Hsp20/alpha crystallin family protein [Candidatus Parcubacteria bacterium]|nr:Hsp20/alpha crystallin family protein [Candidatus Paceibacterota bacterium]
MYATQFGSSALVTEEDRDNNISFDSNSSWMPEAVPQLTVDMYYRGDFIYIVSTVAGVQASDLDIAVESGVLFIKGVRRKPYKDSEVNTELSECFWGEFMRELPLPDNVNVDTIEANLNNGILIVKIPVLKVKAKKIQIRVS